jgi:hypothetical protein
MPKKPAPAPSPPPGRKNRFGDPSDTLYAGGTPLFDEGAGRGIDKRPKTPAKPAPKPVARPKRK